jgi:hypothetical protein
MTTIYALNFDGYWRETNIGGMPGSSGIYGVYACCYDPYGKTVSMQRLLYIGEAADIYARVANHEKWSEWRRQLRSGELLCLNAALLIGQASRQCAETAMIFTHKPPCNTEYRDCFPFDTATGYSSSVPGLLQLVSWPLLKGGKCSPSL